MESCEHENADNVDANPYNKRVPQRVRVAQVKVLKAGQAPVSLPSV